MENTLKGSEYLYNHPEKRAHDFMDAFVNPSVKAIFSCIGGDESVRMLPYIDFDIIRNNPKILIGYSDTTISHLMCLKAGVSSFYGPSLLAELAENIKYSIIPLNGCKKYCLALRQLVKSNPQHIGRVKESNGSLKMRPSKK